MRWREQQNGPRGGIFVDDERHSNIVTFIAFLMKCNRGDEAEECAEGEDSKNGLTNSGEI